MKIDTHTAHYLESLHAIQRPLGELLAIVARFNELRDIFRSMGVDPGEEV